MILALEGEAGEGVFISHYEERIQMSLVLISDDWFVELGQTCEAARNGTIQSFKSPYFWVCNKSRLKLYMIFLFSKLNASKIA